MSEEKQHKGKITNWIKLPSSHGIGYVIFGESDGHPQFHGGPIRTSWVEKHDLVTGEIETRNSRYTLVGPEFRP